MKLYILIFIVLCCNLSFSQCPQPGLKIQTAACNSVNALRVDAITCSVLNVKWQGNQNQTYVVKATGINPTTNNTYEAEASKYSCDSYGNCTATIPVKEGTNVNWSVQGICTEGSATLFGYKSDGQQVYIPVCKQVTNTTTSKLLRVYPNPTTGDLTLNYNGKVTDKTAFTIYDVSGERVFSIMGDAVTKTNEGYKLNLRRLTSGSYLLKVSNGKEESQAKFVLIKN